MTSVVAGLVSTVIPVHNRAGLLQEAVESALAQTYRPLEVIICDDGSTDDTPEAAEALRARYPREVRVVRQARGGPGPAREAGRRLAQGEFVQYLDSDDLLRPQKFELQVRALRDRTDCGVAYGYACLRNGAKIAQETPFKWTGRSLPELFPALLVDRWWTTNAPLYRRTVCEAVGPWSDLRWSQDWEYDGRVGALRTRLVHTRQWVCDWRRHAGERQTSPADWRQPLRARERKRFLGLLLRHAKRAGVTPEQPEMQHFSRWLFQTARLCGAAGLVDDARECFAWAREAAGPERSARSDFRIYEWAAGRFGWRFMGTLACWLDEHAWRRHGRATLPPSWAEA
jgi:glycosyltransferase involved in cell wall biosynthesis